MKFKRIQPYRDVFIAELHSESARSDGGPLIVLDGVGIHLAYYIVDDFGEVLHPIQGYFVSPQESGEICMLACMLGRSGEIFFPKMDEPKDARRFSDIAAQLLAAFPVRLGLNKGGEPSSWPRVPSARALQRPVPTAVTLNGGGRLLPSRPGAPLSTKFFSLKPPDGMRMRRQRAE